MLDKIVDDIQHISILNNEDDEVRERMAKNIAKSSLPEVNSKSTKHREI